jgi:hypothetical protein
MASENITIEQGSPQQTRCESSHQHPHTSTHTRTCAPAYMHTHTHTHTHTKYTKSFEFSCREGSREFKDLNRELVCLVGERNIALETVKRTWNDIRTCEASSDLGRGELTLHIRTLLRRTKLMKAFSGGDHNTWPPRLSGLCVSLRWCPGCTRRDGEMPLNIRTGDERRTGPRPK